MKQILNFPAEGVPPSIGAQRRAAMHEDVCGTDACFLCGSA